MTTDNFDLTGKTVLVTGATDGLGRALAGKLAASGATILIHGRDPERIRKTEADNPPDHRVRPTANLPGELLPPGRSTSAQRRDPRGRETPRRPRQQCWHRHHRTGRRRANAERRRLRVALRGQLPRRILANADATARSDRSGTHTDRERQLRRTGADRLRRRHAQLPFTRPHTCRRRSWPAP